MSLSHKELDSIDNKIISILQKDGRISIKKLSDLINLTPPATAERVKRLENIGLIIGYSAKINAKKMGKSIMAIIHVSMRARHHKEFFEIIENESCILECHHMTGAYCMILKAVFDNTGELETLINKLQKFGDTNTSIILSSPLEFRAIK